MKLWGLTITQDTMLPYELSLRAVEVQPEDFCEKSHRNHFFFFFFKVRRKQPLTHESTLGGWGG